MRRGPLASALTCLALVAACGGDDDGGDDSTTTTEEVEDESTTTNEGDETTTTTGEDEGATGAPGSEAMCAAYQAVADVNAGFQEDLGAIVLAIAFSDDPAQAQEAFEALQQIVEREMPPLLDAYDDLAAEVPDDLVDDVELVRSFTSDFVDALAATPDVESFESAMEAIESHPDAAAADEAAQAIAQHGEDACGISITS